MPELAAHTSVVIGAVDKTGAAFRSLLGNFNAAQSASDKFANALKGLGGALAIREIANVVMNIVEAADALDDLSQKTGASVESLSKFAGVARVTGQDIGAVESSMARLSKSLVEAQDGGSEAARAFAAFGVNIRDAGGNLRTSGDVMDDLARKQQGFSDGAGKAAAMMALLGKTGSELIPFLNDYVRYGDDVVAVTAEEAAAAGDFNDQIGLLQEQINSLLRNTILPLLPQMKAVVESFQALGRAVAEVVPSGRNPFEFILQAVRETNTQTIGEIAYLRQAWENFKLWWKGEGDQRIAPVAAREAAIVAEEYRQLETALNAVEAAAGNTSGTQARTVAFQASGQAARANAEANKAAAEALRQWKEQEKAFADQRERYLKVWLDYEQDAAKYAAELAQARQRDNEAAEASIRSIFESVNALEREVEQLSMSNEERERSTMLLALENSGLDVNSQAYLDLAERIENATRAKREFANNQAAIQANAEAAKRAADEWQRTADSIRDSLTDALLRGFESGKDFAKNLRDTLVNMFKTLVLRPIIQATLAPIAGGIGSLFPGSSAASGILGGGGGGFDLLSLFGGGGGGLAGIGNWIAGLGGGGGGFFGGLGGGLANFGVEGLFGGIGMNFSGGLAALGAGNILGGLGSLLAGALPIVGIGAALASAFGLFDRGGPKTGGSASSLAELTEGTVGLGSLERLFTPDAKDSDVQKVTDSIAQSFINVARSLGLSGSAQFGLGFDTDPEGEAPNRVSSIAQLNGQTVYQQTDLDLGRDGDIAAALELEAKRALFAALKASDMPVYLADLFAGIEAEGATAEQIDNIIQTAAALKLAVDAMAGLGEQFAAMDPADVQGFVEAFGGLEGLMQRFAFIGENFYTDAEKLDKATELLASSFEALGIAVPDTHRAFLDLLNSLDLTTEEGRQMYEAISALAPLFVQVRGTAQQAAAEVEDLDDALDDLGTTIVNVVSNIVDAGASIGFVNQQAADALARAADLAREIGGSIGDQLTTQIQVVNGEIARFTEIWRQQFPGSAESQATLDIIGILQNHNALFAAQIARYRVLEAQFGSDRADALYQLEQWYYQQQQILQGNSVALAALADLFADRWQEIIDGVAGGVEGTLSELDRLRESLRDYLDRLVLRQDLSPLSPTAQLAEAQRQYQDLLDRAAAGDVDALREIQGAADAYLQIARQLYASGPEFNAIWQQVVEAISGLAEPPATGGPEPRPEELLADALPTDSPLASQADIERMAAAIIAAMRDGTSMTATATARSAELIAETARPRK